VKATESRQWLVKPNLCTSIDVFECLSVPYIQEDSSLAVTLVQFSIAKLSYGSKMRRWNDSTTWRCYRDYLPLLVKKMHSYQVCFFVLPGIKSLISQVVLIEHTLIYLRLVVLNEQNDSVLLGSIVYYPCVIYNSSLSLPRRSWSSEDNIEELSI